ncbi:MAG: NfeD family protein [Microbacteriaceae bacterium]|nr:NfeD family protein [Microbacteriaceae bacterium]MCL2794873.1 NfeD family protein [Microbacteriaceae bacterium]
MDGFEWVIWAGLIVVFVAVAMATTEIEFMLLALGALGGLIVVFVGGSWWVAFIVAAVIAVLSTFLLRPRLLHLLERNADPAKSNIDAIVGTVGRVILQVTPVGGQVKLANGETWSARLADETAPQLSPGTEVHVLAVDGASVVIAPIA